MGGVHGLVTCTVYFSTLTQDRNMFHRFDKFNSKYNPIGKSVCMGIRACLSMVWGLQGGGC